MSKHDKAVKVTNLNMGGTPEVGRWLELVIADPDGGSQSIVLEVDGNLAAHFLSLPVQSMFQSAYDDDHQV